MSFIVRYNLFSKISRSELYGIIFGKMSEEINFLLTLDTIAVGRSSMDIVKFIPAKHEVWSEFALTV